MDTARLDALLRQLRQGHPDLAWTIEPDQDGVGATADLSRTPRGEFVALVELTPGVPSVRTHVERSFVFEEVPDGELEGFLEAVLSGRMRRLPPTGFMQRLLRVKTLQVEGRGKAWVATR